MKVKFFNGIKFICNIENDYYRKFDDFRITMHRYVWEYYNGKIPNGYEVHHIDFNKENNSISNLELLTKEEHKKLHADTLTEEQREWRHNNMIKTAQPAAKQWHKSVTGKMWHSQHILNQHASGIFKREMICDNCGKSFTGDYKNGHHFCSNSCKSAYRRKMKLDYVPANCVICGKEFMTNKFRPSKTCCRSCTNKMIHANRRDN